MRIVKAPDQLLVFERPDVYVLVLATDSKQRVVRRQRQTSDVMRMLKRHETFRLVPCNVVQLDALVHR